MTLTQEQKDARKAARLAKLAADKEKEQQEFLVDRERFRSNVPYSALRMIARATSLAGAYVDVKVSIETEQDGDNAGREYCRVRLWNSSKDLNVDFPIWEGVAQTASELNLRRWELQEAACSLEMFERNVNEELKRKEQRRELLARLTPEERELLGV